MSKRPKVAIYKNALGEIVYIFGSDVDVYFIDETIPNDRVFQLSSSEKVTPEDLIGSSPIGHKDDELQTAFRNKVHFMQHGLKEVPKKEE